MTPILPRDRTLHTAGITGVGMSFPERRLTNADLEAMVDTTEDWITSRTGIKERHIAAPGEACSDLAAAAARQALADAGLSAEDLTHILLGTFTPDCYVPAAAYILQEKLGLRGRTAMDFSAACTGFIAGLELCRAFLALHPEAVILLAASEAISSRINGASFHQIESIYGHLATFQLSAQDVQAVNAVLAELLAA